MAYAVDGTTPHSGTRLVFICALPGACQWFYYVVFATQEWDSQLALRVIFPAVFLSMTALGLILSFTAFFRLKAPLHWRILVPCINLAFPVWSIAV